MRVGLFDVAVPAKMDKWRYFLRGAPPPKQRHTGNHLHVYPGCGRFLFEAYGSK